MQADYTVRDSGLVVPAALAGVPERPASATTDADGKHRVVLTNDERKLLIRAVKLLEDRGFALVVRCQHRAVMVPRHGKPTTINPRPFACGEVLKETSDGAECQCSRLHLR
jgi:hypothetical protein